MLDIIRTPRWTKNDRIPYDSNQFQNEKYCGYQLRTGKVQSIIIHSTNGTVGSSFEGEVNFLVESRDVSAHYLIAKDGRIVEMLDPSAYCAWHAGLPRSPMFSNQNSVGIENHYSPGEGEWPIPMKNALTNLTNELMRVFSLSKSAVETHRNIAIPIGRKIDPSGFADVPFYSWRDTLTGTNNPAAVLTKKVRWNTVVRLRPSRLSPVVMQVQQNSTLELRSKCVDEQAIFIAGTNIWYEVVSINATTIGYIHASGLIL